MVAKNIIRAILLVVLTAAPVFAIEAKLRERDYQVPWCEAKGGLIEVVIPGGRIDCQLDYYSVEVDFARKWAEAIGQAKFYGASTMRSPGVLLIIETPDDFKYLYKLLKAVQNDRFRWAVWVVWGF